MIYWRFFGYICHDCKYIVIVNAPLNAPHMAVTFTVKDANRERSYVQILVRFRGQFYKKSSGETIPVKYWNPKKHRCNVPKDFPAGQHVNEVLDKWEAATNEAIAAFKVKMGTPSAQEFWDACNRLFYKGSCDVSYVVDYLTEYIERVRGAKSVSTISKYTTTLNKLQEFEGITKRRLKFQDIDINFYIKFRTWLYGQGYSANYFGSHIKNIKHIIHEAAYEGVCTDLHGIQHRDFITINESSDNIYLSLDELRRIYELDITVETVRKHLDVADIRNENLLRKVESLRLVRDRFIIGAFTGLRVSDFGRLSEANIGPETIRIKTAKTGAVVVIPIHPYVRGIIQNGFDASVQVSDQKMNKHLKELAKMAGIDEEVTINKNVGGVNEQRIYKKYELVCTHTARRSFATNAYKSGVPTIAIMKITGHTKESTFLRYIKVSAEENAEMLMEHPFFKH